MEQNGFIKLHRKIRDNWVWKDPKPFDMRSAWIDLLMLANWNTHTGITKKDKLITYQRGVVYCSQLELSRRWNWDRKKVTRFLKNLEASGMCSVNGTTEGTTISLTNYDFYQGDGATERATEGQLKVQQKDTIEERKERIIKTNNKKGIEREIDLDAQMLDKIINSKGSGRNTVEEYDESSRL